MLKLALAAAMLAVAAPALADDWDFVLINSSGKAIAAVELAPTGTTAWQPNQVDPDFAKADRTMKPAASRSSRREQRLVGADGLEPPTSSV